MARIRLTLCYDGTAYHGWQVQPNAVTVQQVLQDAIERITGVRSGVTGCSRTDAGVHARMFCCAFDTASPLRGDKLCNALNAVLPRDVAVYEAEEVDEAFHPRYDAKGKRYVYHLHNGRHRDPFAEGYAWHVRWPLDEQALDRAAKDLIGTHDFAAFCAAGSSVEDTVRTVSHAAVTREGDRVTFSVEADGFLYNMVRIMVGTLHDMAAGKLPYDAIPAILQSGDRAAAGVTAPPHGLCLERVFYEERKGG
ncbi:MAG: tRNA pseudouridine(38-40) synthase TruA [Clostridia bacterium]|nr:tRNA pseudouridine(38-40) synthase TruA [Clostridia bacterium]